MSWRVIGASAPGKIHQKNQTLCQDAFAYRLLHHNIAVLAVADGAGFAVHAEEGAKIAVEQAVDSLTALLGRCVPDSVDEWHSLMHQAFNEVLKALTAIAERRNENIKSFSTTLTAAVLTEHSFVVGQVGDGIAVGETYSGSLFLAVPPQRGEYANQSVFMTMPRVTDYLDIRIYPQPLRALVMSTDGLMRLALKLPEYEPHGAFFSPLLDFAMTSDGSEATRQQLLSFLTSERVSSRTDDDKTLVLAVRSVPPANAKIKVLSKRQSRESKAGDASC